MQLFSVLTHPVTVLLIIFFGLVIGSIAITLIDETDMVFACSLGSPIFTDQQHEQKQAYYDLYNWFNGGAPSPGAILEDLDDDDVFVCVGFDSESNKITITIDRPDLVTFYQERIQSAYPDVDFDVREYPSEDI